MFNETYNLLLEKFNVDDTVISQLIPYAYDFDEDYYLHFSEFNKIGNNPNSQYDTPQGIYLYPLKEYWNMFLKKNLSFSVEKY